MIKPTFMLSRASFLLLASLPLVAEAQQAPPEKALKYHETLLKRPHNAALFDRFFSAWLDELPIESMGNFLTARAQANGGQEWTVLARYQLRRGQEDEALQSLAKAIEAVPDDPVLLMERAKIRLRRLEFAAARMDLEKAAVGKDELLAVESSKLLGKTWVREGKPEEAVKVWDALLQVHPNEEDLLEDLVETAAAEGEIAKALSYADKLIELGSDPYKKTLRRMRRGDLLVSAGRSDEAVETYAATLELVGEGTWLEREVMAQIEKIFRKQDRLDDLTAQLKALAEKNPRRLLIHRQLAKLEAAQGQADVAIGRFREVLQRSPGDRELREEFVRLLTDSERFDDAAAELDKLIALNPNEPGLSLQLAALRHRQGNAKEVLAALQKAHALLGKEESPSLRIAGLMLQYGQNEAGESLLRELVNAPGASAAATEALAAHLGRINRKEEAIDLLKKLGASDDADVVIRSASSIAGLGNTEASFALLASRAEKFAAEPRFLTAYVQAALAAGKAADVSSLAIRLVRLAKQSTELSESINLVVRVMTETKKVEEWRAILEKQATRMPSETCLLGALMEAQGEFDKVSTLLDPITDPLVVHFHAALLDRRGEFDKAVVVLLRLADSEEGRKAAYFKDLCELQQRAGNTGDALATIERWKQTAPGDKTAWIVGTRLLRESGRMEEAVKAARQAAARFEGDVDLAANLAALQDEAGQWNDAEAIYWRLYDEGQTPSDQARWASQLAQLALKSGRIEELAEKLRERARGNRNSVGPILAQAELARVSQNEEKYRELLLEAVRLQPKDIDLRLQIANLEEKSGSMDRVVAVLEEALPQDSSGRIRSALAQAYLRQGQTLKGLRELRALAGKQGTDARWLENNAASLAGAGLYDEAIQFLRSELPQGGDWRSRYLLATLLETDGREAEAIPMFFALLNAEGDIKLPKITSATQPGEPYWEDYSPELKKLTQQALAKTFAYIHKKDNRYGSVGFYPGYSMVGGFALPDEVNHVRQLALIHLCMLSKAAPKEQSAALMAQIKATGLPDIDFLYDFSGISSEDPQALVELLAKYPQQRGLLEWALLYSAHVEIDTVLLRKLLEDAGNLPAEMRFSGWLAVARKSKPEDPAWKLALAAAKEGIGESKPEELHAFGNTLVALYTGVDEESLGESQNKNLASPEQYREEIKQLAFLVLAKLQETPQQDEEVKAYLLWMLGQIGTPEQWIKEMNLTVQQYRKEMQGKSGGISGGQSSYTRLQHQIAMIQSRSSGNTLESAFSVPTLETMVIRSVPETIIQSFRSEVTDPFAPDLSSLSQLAQEVEKRESQIESPFLRAWLAIKSGQKEKAAEALKATPMKGEEADFEVLRSVQALAEKKPVEAMRCLEKARTIGGSNREYQGWLNVSLIAIASGLTPEERAQFTDVLQAAMTQCRLLLGASASPMLASKAQALGLEDLAKRLQPPAAAQTAGGGSVAGFSSGARSSSSSASATEKIKKLIGEKKHESAAREVLQLIHSGRSNQWGNRNEKETLKLLDDPSRQVLIKLVDPGESKSLVKRTEYADICIALEKRDLALKALESLHAERPDDAAIIARLAFLLPQEEATRRLDLMTRAAANDAFVLKAIEFAEAIESDTDARRIVNFYDTIATWLEKTEPAALEKANLSWVGYFSKEFFDSSYYAKLPDLLEPSESPDGGDKSQIERREAVARRLAVAMQRHPAIAEEGFRLIRACKKWALPPEELDSAARAALVAPRNRLRMGESDVFTRYVDHSSSSSSGSLDEFSTVDWLIQRVKETKNSAGIVPPAFREQLRTRNAKLADSVIALAELQTVDQLRRIMESDIMEDGVPSSARPMLQHALMQHAGAVPGAVPLFLEILAKQKSDAKPRSRYYFGMPDDGENDMVLYSAAIRAGLAGKDEELSAVCAAISKALLGEKPNWEKPANGEQLLQGVYQLHQLTSAIQPENPRDALRLCRAWFANDLPWNDNDGFLESFEKQKFTTVEDAEKFLESMGFLTDASQWTALAAWSTESSREGTNEVTFKREKKLILGDACSNLNLSFSSEELIKRLAARKQGRFGSLITAAMFADESETQALVVKAFTDCSAELAKLPPAKLKEFEILLPLLTEDAAEKLPPVLASSLKKANNDSRTELLKSVEEFLARKDQQQTYGDPFDPATPLIAQLVEFDPDKAVTVFLECERRATQSRSQQRSSVSSDDEFQVAQRDRELGSLFSRISSSDQKSKEHALRFYLKLVQRPEAGRFTFSPSTNRGFDDLIEMGQTLRWGVANSVNHSDHIGYARRIFDLVRALPEDLRKTALLAITTHEIVSHGPQGKGFATMMRKDVAALRQEFPEEFPYLIIRYGITGYNFDTPEGRDETRKALGAVLNDKSLPETTRLCLAVNCARYVSGILGSTDVAPQIAELYENYCAAERSAVNAWSSVLVQAVGTVRTKPETIPYTKRILEAFWKNANTPKPGGHSQIPISMTIRLFRASAHMGDTDMARKMLSQTKGAHVGNQDSITQLIGDGQFDLARMLLPPKGRPYPAMEKFVTAYFTKDVEANLEPFLATVSDPQVRLQACAQILLMPDGSELYQPKTPRSARFARLAEEYKKNPPQEPEIQSEILRHIISNDQLASMGLCDELTAWAKSHDLKGCLEACISQAGADDATKMPRAKNEMNMAIVAALAGLERGDPSLLEKIADTLVQSHVYPKDDTSEAHRKSTETLRWCHANLMNASALWFCVAVSRDHTTGFEKALPSYEKLTLIVENRPEFERKDLHAALANYQFLALWTGSPQNFEKLTARMKYREQGVKAFQPKTGLVNFAANAAACADWKKPEFTQYKREFLLRVLGKESLASAFPDGPVWIEQLAGQGLDSILFEIGNRPPAEFLPCVRSQLVWYRGKKLASQKKAEESFAALRQAIEVAMPGADGGPMRGSSKYELAKELNRNKRTAEAVQVMESVTPEEGPDWVKGIYRKDIEDVNKAAAAMNQK